MWKDEMVEETQKVREEYAEKFNCDLEAIYKDLKEQEGWVSGRSFQCSRRSRN